MEVYPTTPPRLRKTRRKCAWRHTIRRRIARQQWRPRAVSSGLTPSDYAALEERWIDREVADRAGLRRVDSLNIVWRKSGNYAGIIIPYFRPGADYVREYRPRHDHPEMEYDSTGGLKPRQKYLSPPGRSKFLYLPPGTPQHLLRDVSVVITEGEFKTLALWQLANHRAPDQPRFLPVGVSGVCNRRGTIGKPNGPDGSRLDVKGAIPDLDWIARNKRRVVIAYDADRIKRHGAHRPLRTRCIPERARGHRWFSRMGREPRQGH